MKNFNAATSFRPARVDKCEFHASLVHKFGNVSMYYCESKTREEAVDEVKRAIKEYESSIFFCDEITEFTLCSKLASLEKIKL